jgi:PBSX family phage terminase large subunit
MTQKVETIHLTPTWSFLPRQIIALDSLDKYGFTLYSGAVGAGKTLLLAHAAIKACINYPGCKGIIGSLTYTQLKNVVFTVFKEELWKYQDLLRKNNIPVQIVKNISASHGKMYVEFTNGSVIYFLAMDKEEKIRGYTIDFFCLDEPIEIDETIFDQLIARRRGKVLPKSFGLLTTNPGAETHWIWQRFFKNTDSNYFHIETTTYDNIFLPPDYIKQMEEAYDEDWIRRFLNGKWGAYEGQIYKTFNRDKHIVEDIERNFKYIIAGVDFGVRNPSVILTIGITSENLAIVIDEYYKPTTSVALSKVLKALHEKWKYKKVWCDPSALDLITQCKRIGIPVFKADNDVPSGIAKVKSVISKNQLLVSRNCHNTIRELESYRYKKDKTGENPEERPIKCDDHTCDALRYALIMTRIFGYSTSIGWLKKKMWSIEDA